MRNIISAVLVLVLTTLLSGCYVSSSADNVYYSGYSPGYARYSGWNTGGWGYGRWGRNGWGYNGWGHHGGWGYHRR